MGFGHRHKSDLLRLAARAGGCVGDALIDLLQVFGDWWKGHSWYLGFRNVDFGLVME
jgi:hypothetical protein